MNIKINNEPKEIDSKDVLALADELHLPERGVAIAVNNAIVPRTEWAKHTLAEGDNVTVIKAAFGG